MDDSAIYHEGNRILQDKFDSRRIADRLEQVTLHDAFSGSDVEFIQNCDMFFLATADADGWPDVSYKGGDVGFVQVVNPNELRIPIFDGNGMWRTLGNVMDDGRVAVLFLDPQRPWRMRVHGRATVSLEASDLAAHVGAQAVLVVQVTRVFPNCGRYIHPTGAISEFVPQPDTEPPIPEWKRIEALRAALPARDQEALAREDSAGST